MEIYLSIDDTDNLESCGTGELASQISENIQQQGWGECSYITRHQLFIHPDIPYTSHNSSMCFHAQIEDSALGQVINYASDFLARVSAVGSDPGLCVALPAKLGCVPELIDFGQQAKRIVLTKAQAYELAVRSGVHLSQHGGTGQGVIGAIAGIGLRMGGEDGRLKGKIAFDTDPSDNGIAVTKVLDHPWVAAVQTEQGHLLQGDERICLVDKVKIVQVKKQPVLLVQRNEQGGWQNLTRQQLKKY